MKKIDQTHITAIRLAQQLAEKIDLIASNQDADFKTQSWFARLGLKAAALRDDLMTNPVSPKARNPWWKAPESDDEHHTAFIWSVIEREAREAGDTQRADEARAAKEQQARSEQ